MNGIKQYLNGTANRHALNRTDLLRCGYRPIKRTIQYDITVYQSATGRQVLTRKNRVVCCRSYFKRDGK